jgi:phosphoribosylamine--glycine ligase
MRVLLIDQEGIALDFALRCAAHDHEVRWYRFDEKRRGLKDGTGFEQIKIVDDWREHLRWVGKDGLIWLSGNFRFLHELDRLRTDFDFKVFGPTVASAQLEITRSDGMDLMRSIGANIPPFETFDSLNDALAFARKSDRAWVHKPMGDEGDKSLTYVSKDPADLVGWLSRQIKRGKKTKGKVMLQEKIEGVEAEIGVSGWMGSDGFLPEKWNVCFEHKPLMDGDIGPATGEQGTVMQYVEEDKLAAEMLSPLAPTLRALGHTGDFAIGAMVDRKGTAWFLEFTARAGWPAFYIQTAEHRGDPASWMRDALDGKDTLRVSTDVAVGVVLAQPRYPYGDSKPELVEGNPIEGVDEVYDDLHLAQVMRGTGPQMKGGKVVDAPTYETSGEYVMVATALGKTVEAARKRVYRTIDKVHFADMMYRTDIGVKVQKNLPKLQVYGYALDMEGGA